MIKIKPIKDLKKYSIRIHKKPEPRSHNPALPSLFFSSSKTKPSCLNMNS